MVTISGQVVQSFDALKFPTRFRCSGEWIKPSNVQLPLYHEIFARYSVMTNDGLLEEEARLRLLVSYLKDDHEFEERNLLVPNFQILGSLIDYGFHKGEKVHRRSATMWIEDVIREVDGNCMIFNAGIYPPGLVRKITPENAEEARKMVSYS